MASFSTYHHELKKAARAAGYKLFMKNIQITAADTIWNASHTEWHSSRVEFTDAASGAEFVATRESADAPWKLCEILHLIDALPFKADYTEGSTPNSVIVYAYSRAEAIAKFNKLHPAAVLADMYQVFDPVWSASEAPQEAPKTPDTEENGENLKENTSPELEALKERHTRNESALTALNHFEAELYKLFPLDAARVTPLAMNLAEAVGKVKELINSDDFQIIRALSERIAPENTAMLPDYIYKENGLHIRIAEGTGDNLLDEDIENGYCDYLMYYVYETREDAENEDEDGEIDGGMILLEKMAHEQFTSLADAVPLVNGMVFS